MPTSTRRQAHARSRNEDTSEAVVQITSDSTPPGAETIEVEPDHDMEDEGLDGAEEDDEDALGEGFYDSTAM